MCLSVLMYAWLSQPLRPACGAPRSLLGWTGWLVCLPAIILSRFSPCLLQVMRIASCVLFVYRGSYHICKVTKLYDKEMVLPCRCPEVVGSGVYMYLTGCWELGTAADLWLAGASPAFVVV